MCLSNMRAYPPLAGALGVAPRTSVLETEILLLNYAPKAHQGFFYPVIFASL